MIFNNCNPFVKRSKSNENELCIYFYNRLWDLAITLYKWEGNLFSGKDATCNNDYLEFILLSQGYAAFIQDKQNNIRSLRCSRLYYDPYMFPTELLASNPILGNLTGKVNKDCVWIRNNKFATPAVAKIAYYAEQLAKIQLSLNISLNNNRMTKVFFADNDMQAQQIRQFQDDLSSGVDAVIIKSSLKDDLFADGNKIPVYGTPSEYLAANYIQDMRSVMNDFLVCFGVNCNGANVIKKERNLVDEVNSNNQEVLINREFWLAPRREAAEILNEIFGTDVVVNLREEFRDEELQQSEPFEE